MSLGITLAAELQYEALSTRKMLEIVPDESFEWQPHEKSMTLGKLALHISELPQWARVALTQEEFDFAKNIQKPFSFNTSAELVNRFDLLVSDAFELLQHISDSEIMRTWRLRNGEKILAEMPRAGVIRSMVLNHLFHHRGQLSVYLRLQNVPLPAVYGSTADEQTF
jgi:uncharacterized damage-inducible protein DinB